MHFIEFVCTGNLGRSPIAEAIAGCEFKKLKANYKVRSSGTKVDELARAARGKNIEEGLARKLVSVGVGRKIYNSFSEDAARILGMSELGSYDSKQLQKFANQALVLFEPEEAKLRNEALHNCGIDAKLKSIREQTRGNPDSILVLGMDIGHVDEIFRIYNLYGLNPRADTLERYSGFEQTGFKGAFGSGSLDAYISLVRRMQKCVASAIDRFMGE